MKTLKLYSNGLEKSEKIKEELIELLDPQQLKIVGWDQPSDYIITFGGDGTLISAFHEFEEYLDQSLFIGIHTGHLGFYTDWQSFELQALVDSLIEGDKGSISYPLLEGILRLKGGEEERFLALNEMIIRSQQTTMVGEVAINNSFLETFRGDGLCIATPTGSTGLNKSLGGAVIHPRLDAIQMTEIASINNRVFRTLGSALIIPRDEWIEVFPEANPTLTFTVDNQHYDNLDIESVTFRIAAERIQFASFRHTHYWDRVENSFIGKKKKHQRS